MRYRITGQIRDSDHLVLTIQGKSQVIHDPSQTSEIDCVSVVPQDRVRSDPQSRGYARPRTPGYISSIVDGCSRADGVTRKGRELLTDIWHALRVQRPNHGDVVEHLRGNAVGILHSIFSAADNLASVISVGRFRVVA